MDELLVRKEESKGSKGDTSALLLMFIQLYWLVSASAPELIRS